jgi:outer membrane cobalamin receptor
MRTTLMTSALALGLSAAGGAYAQSPAPSDPTSVSEVQVTARTLEDTLPEQLAQTGVKVDVIPHQAILNGGYPDVATSLQALAPGLYIQPINGPFSYVDISLLGSRTEDVLWLVDGVRINNRLYASTPPLDTMPAGMVDRLEILDGGQALFYGTQAVAGAINIVTKPFRTDLGGQITAAVDTNQGRHLDANVASSLPVGQFVLFGSADKSEGYQPFRNQDYQPSATDRNQSYDVYTIGAKYQVDLTQQLRFTGSYQHTDADIDLLQPYKTARDVNMRKEDIATAKLDYQATDNLGLFVKTYWHNWHTTYDTFENSLTEPGTLVDLYNGAFWGYKDYGVNALGKWDIVKGVQAYFGYDFQSYGGRDEVLVIQQHDEHTHAAFGQLRLTPDLVPGLSLAAGFRYNAPSVGESATVWNVSGKYELPSGFYVKGEAGTNFRLPTAEELFANDPLDERGNPDLKPERSTSGNLTLGAHVDMAGHRLTVEATGFARDVQDLIDYDTFDDATQQSVFGNVAGTVRTRGGQVSADLAVSHAFNANLNYTYSKTTEDNGQQLARVPLHLIKAGVDWHPADLPIGATATFSYTGDVYSPPLPESTTPINYGNYALVDLSGRWYIDAGRHQQLNLSIRNLLDRQYGRPANGCRDVAGEGPYDCSSRYLYYNLGQPRTFTVSYSYSF